MKRYCLTLITPPKKWIKNYNMNKYTINDDVSLTLYVKITSKNPVKKLSKRQW